MTPIDPKSVSTPADHGRVYYFKENVEKLRWLWAEAMPEDYIQESATITDFDWFCNEQLRLVTVDLSDRKSDLKVVRVFSPLLVPINFGFDSAHYTHPVVQYSVGVNPDSLKMPHYFA